MSDTGGPAFPIGSGDMRDPTGMTLRDYFAAKAMAAYIIDAGSYDRANESNNDWELARMDDLAVDAYRMADFMIEERKINNV